MGWPFVAFDLNPSVVKVRRPVSSFVRSCMLCSTNGEEYNQFFTHMLQSSRKLGFPVLYGDGSRPAVLQSAGISSPKAVMVMYSGKEKILEAVQRIRLAFPAVFISLTVALHDFMRILVDAA